jgi:hypothetical protein
MFVIGVALPAVLLLTPSHVAARPSAPTSPSREPPAGPSNQKPAEPPGQPPDAKGKKKKKAVASRIDLPTKEARLAFIRRAQVWAPTNVSEMDMRMGPQGPGAFQPNEMVTCDFVTAKLSGSSRKFDCRTGDGKVVKVRYGTVNGEVEGSVLASRLLWALGFGADRDYPVRVTCRGCSTDPWTKRAAVPGEQVFDPATIEVKSDGHEMKAGNNEGWAWPELALVDEAYGGATRAQRDALTLLAVFMQHTDSKTVQQRLLCLPGGMTSEGVCDKPFLMVHDVGLTFGHGNFLNRTTTGSVNFTEWARTPVWRDGEACVAHMSQSKTGTLGDPHISDAGRQFLADLLVQLTDRQLRDLFEVARVDRRSRTPNRSVAPATIDEWVTAFKQKRDEIVNHTCPVTTSREGK